MKTQVFAIPTHEDCTDPAILVTDRDGVISEAEAVQIVRDAGYTVIAEGDGGLIASYDAEDAHSIFGADAGCAGIGVTVIPDAA